MVDKPGLIARSKLGPPIGRLTDDDMAIVNRNVALFLGFA